MRFVRHGPDIPERLLQLHEDGRVVFLLRRGAFLASAAAGLYRSAWCVWILHP